MSLAGDVLQAMCGGQRLLVSGPTIGKPTKARRVVIVVMQIMLATFILRQLFSFPESPV
jgi:hypothetical protein